MYVILMLLLINLSTTSYSEENSNAEVWQALATSLGTTLQGLATTNQAATMAALTQQIADLDSEMLSVCNVNGARCGSQCKKCSDPKLCNGCDLDKCQTMCKTRKQLNRAKYLNWNTLLSLAGIAATTAATALQPEEEKRTCAQKCAGLSGKEYDTCLKNNTSEYGEPCDYTPPAGRCDDTDPMLKKDEKGVKLCEGFTGGCDLYIQQCRCNLQAEQTKQPYAWNISKSACLLQAEGGGEDGTAKAGDDIAVGDDKDAKAKNEEKAKALAGGSGSALSSKGTGATGTAATAKKGAEVKDPKKASLGDTAGGAFKDQNYIGMVGESGGTQGEGSSSSKKATDIASSKAAETLLDMIHTTYTGYTDAGRFLSADVKVEKGKTKDAKRIKRKKV